MGMKYILGNFINSSTLSSVSSEETIYPKENMYNRRQSLPWRMDAKSGNAVCDLGSNRPTALALMNHNFVGTGAFSLKIEADNDPPNWGSPAYSQAISFHKQNIFYTFSQNYRWWRVIVSDPDNLSNLEIGEIILYTHGTFTMNYIWPYKDILDYVVDENVTHYGVRHRVKRAKRKLFALDFENVTDANLIAEVEVFFEALDGERPFVFIPDESGTKSWYVYCLNSMDATRVFLNTNKFYLRLEEQSRGITLLGE